MIGNKIYALKSYYQTVKGIIDFCHEISIKYIILGPNRRNNSYLEPSLCKGLGLYIPSKIDGAYLWDLSKLRKLELLILDDFGSSIKR